MEDTMTQHQLDDFAAFLLRVTLGIMYLAHSLVLKLSTYTCRAGLPTSPLRPRRSAGCF